MIFLNKAQIEAGENPHVNYEASSRTDSLREALRTGKGHTPFVSGNVVRQKIGRQNNYEQAGARYRAIEA
ncbi:MAG: hypothetical protein ACJ74T_01955 [Pyrinomonadaceae bacterium]